MLDKVVKNGHTFLIRHGESIWCMVGEVIDSRLQWIHVANFDAAIDYIEKRLQCKLDYDKDLISINTLS